MWCINLDKGDKAGDDDQDAIKPINNNHINNNHTIKRGKFNNRNKLDNNHVKNYDIQQDKVNVKSNNTSSGLVFHCQENLMHELEQKKDIVEFLSETMWNPVLKLGCNLLILFFRYLARSDFKLIKNTCKNE